MIRQRTDDRGGGSFGHVIPSVRFDRPIFILAPPRSGSTLLFDCLARFPGVFYIKTEADRIWWRVFPYADSEPPSDFVGRDSVTAANARAIRWLTYKPAVLHHLRHASRYSRWVQFARFLLSRRPIRYLDKTISNCFHLEFLEQAFPDARFIFLVRDPRANISSMIEGWSHRELVGKPQLTGIVRGHTGSMVEHWSFPAPPGWQSVLSNPLPQICAWLWQQHIEYVQRFFRDTSRPKILVRYDDLVADRWGTVAQVAAQLHLDPTGETREQVLALSRSRTVISEPYAGKWRDRNPDVIESILPMIRETAASIGYEL